MHKSHVQDGFFTAIYSKFDMLNEFTATHTPKYKQGVFGIANRMPGWYRDSKVRGRLAACTRD